jgi:glycosyltransferase involved in cell wall biosynthesis
MMKLSVCMITYNHEKYIAQAIESVLMQEVNFDYEIVIGEDCSTDGTREIVKKYAEKYPNKIRVLFHPHNLGLWGKNNFVQTFKACQGQYVALLDGDDYWIDPLKLQKQADFLDNHPECVACFHNIYFDINGKKEVRYKTELKSIITQRDLILCTCTMNTCSVMFRNNLFQEFPPWFYDLYGSDWALHIINSQYGDAGYLNEVMAVYRIHPGGICTRINLMQRGILRIQNFKAHNQFLRYKYNRETKRLISTTSYSIANMAEIENDWKTMRIYLLKGFIANPFNKTITISYLLKSFLKAFFPIFNRFRKE